MTTDERYRGKRAAVSAGGIVYREGADGVEIVVCGRTSEGVWKLPKGTPEPGESLEETALREVAEETGLQVEIERPVGSIRYRFRRGDDTIDKTVEHYLMRPVGGHFDGHDGEFDVVRWAPSDEALALLTFEEDRDVTRRALRLIEEGGA
jgi:8-oxo-dGTP pyrophosphatase MutT (NUDIX family)